MQSHQWVKLAYFLSKKNNAKNKIDDYKKELKNYINSFLKEKINKYPKNKHDYIKNNLIEPYIAKMKTFFLLAENILLNYDKNILIFINY